MGPQLNFLHAFMLAVEKPGQIIYRVYCPSFQYRVTGDILESRFQNSGAMDHDWQPAALKVDEYLATDWVEQTDIP